MSFTVMRGDECFFDLSPQEAADKYRELAAEGKGKVILQDAWADPVTLEWLVQGYKLDRHSGA
jgi:hypothetical protein